MSRELRPLGNSGFKVMPLALGGNVFGWTIDEPTSFSILDAFVAEGFNLIDTADVYSKWKPGNKGGESETIIGRWLAQSRNRDKIVLATKVGMEMGTTEKGLSKTYILRAIEKSLQRLQTDHIDLYQSHEDDPHTPLEETLEAFAQLIQQGKVRAIGASNYSAKRLSEALALSATSDLPRYEVLQPHYNLYDRSVFEKDLEPVCQRERIGVISYYSLASGFLTGKYRSEGDFSKSARGGKMADYLNQRGQRILHALDQVAANHDSTPTRVALAWLIARPSITAPIASATSLGQLKDLTESVNLQLDQQSIHLLDEASS